MMVNNWHVLLTKPTEGLSARERMIEIICCLVIFSYNCTKMWWDSFLYFFEERILIGKYYSGKALLIQILVRDAGGFSQGGHVCSPTRRYDHKHWNFKGINILTCQLQWQAMHLWTHRVTQSLGSSQRRTAPVHGPRKAVWPHSSPPGKGSTPLPQ